MASFSAAEDVDKVNEEIEHLVSAQELKNLEEEIPKSLIALLQATLWISE
jgi:hypothetical protein